MILRDGNGAIYPLAKDCLEGIRDPLWLDLPPLVSLGMGMQSVSSATSNGKNRIALIALALEVYIFYNYFYVCSMLLKPRGLNACGM